MEKGKGYASGFTRHASKMSELLGGDRSHQSKKQDASPAEQATNVGKQPSDWVHAGKLFDNVINLDDYRVVRISHPEEEMDEWW